MTHQANTALFHDIEKEFNDNSKFYEYRTRDYPYEVLCTKYSDETVKDCPQGSLYVPAYQREFVWSDDQKSKYIESVLLGVPLTPFLVSQDTKGKLEIIDGSQRIRTLISFYKNEFKLRKLGKLTSINKLKFKDLPSKLQNVLINRDFRIIVVDDANDNIKKDIFERINTTSLKLTDSEIRKGSYSGDFYDMILELKTVEDFISICPITKRKEKRGEYEELILRFFAYSDKYQESRHDVSNFLNDYLLEQNSSGFSKRDYQKRFLEMVEFVKKNFPFGFRKSEKADSTPRVRFEAISVGVYLALKENPNLENPNLDWLNSRGFKMLTTSDASNNSNRLRNRIEFVWKGLLGRLTDEDLKYGQRN